MASAQSIEVFEPFFFPPCIHFYVLFIVLVNYHLW